MSRHAYSFPEERLEAAEAEKQQRVKRKQGLSGMNQYQLARAHFPDIMDNMEVQKYCMQCGNTYQDLYNMGQWKCRYHPGKLSSQDRTTWLCCNKSTDPHNSRFEGGQHKGCHACDHRDSSVVWKEEDNERLPEAIASVFNFRSDAIVEVEHKEDAFDSWVEVRRAEPFQDE